VKYVANYSEMSFCSIWPSLRSVIATAIEIATSEMVSVSIQVLEPGELTQIILSRDEFISSRDRTCEPDHVYSTQTMKVDLSGYYVR
jgi:hypothetical protein